jgi:hypothetical protein
MRVRAWWTSVVLAGVAVACGDQPMEVVPDRQQMMQTPGMIGSATASSDDGLSITTDKDDYAPGDTVWFTGAGWPADDTLDILLEDDPATHEPHTWSVPVDQNGEFRDSTYVVDVGDIGVQFTLTATSRLTERWLRVQFTDGTIINATIQMRAAPACTTAQGSVAFGSPICAHAAFDITGGGATQSQFRWKSPSGPIAEIAQGPSFPNGATSGTFDDTFVPGGVGIWTVLLCQSANTDPAPGGLPQCASGSQKASQTFTVTAAPTTTVASSSQNPSLPGQSVTLTATVTFGSPGSPVTAGSVTFREGTCASGTILQAAQAVNGSGQVTFTTSSLATGSHPINACYGGTTNFLASTGSITQEVNTSATEIDLISSVNPSVTGQSVMFTATVTSNASPVTAGQVTFKKGGSSCADALQVQAAQTVSGSGVVTYSASFDASASPVTVRACYGGAPSFDASEATLTQVVGKGATSTAVVSSVNPSVFSQPVTFTVSVTPVSPASGTPAGDVTLKSGSCAGASLGGPTALNGSGQATFSVAGLTAGNTTVVGCYLGNDDYTGSNGSVSQTVAKAETSTTLGSSSNPSVFSQAVTFTATVGADAPALATPVGTVVFKNGSCAAAGTLGSDELNGSGVASLTVSTLPVGTHTVTACYQGNSNFEPSDDDVSQIVNKAGTSTGVSSNQNPSVFSQTVMFTVTVTPNAPAVAIPVGSVTLKDGTCSAGATIGGPSALDGSGAASFNVSTLAVGSHTVTGCYGGNPSFEESDGNVLQQVDQASTTTAIMSSVNPSILAQPVTFDVTVSPVAPAVATPVGDVTLKDGTCAAGTTIGGPTALDGSGQVSFNISTLSAGPHTVSACYAGNTSFEGSSGFVAQLVKYNFDGLYAPVDRPNTYNVSKAGQAIPLKWRLTDFLGNPVLTLTAVTVKVNDASCSVGTSADQVEEYASGASGLQNLGDGRYQFNWKTPASYASSCKRLSLEFVPGYAEGPLAYFTFKK